MSLPTAIENIARVRTLLFNPLPSAPTDPQIHEAMQGVLQLHHNELANTQSRWSVDSVPLQFLEGGTEHAIGVGTFGKPFWAYAVDDSGAYLRDVPLYDLVNQRNGWTWDTFRQDSLAVYRVAQEWRARYVGSVTTPPLRVILHYEDTSGEYDRPTDAKGLPPFQALFRLQTCLSVLPGTEWADCPRMIGDKINPAHAAKLSQIAEVRNGEVALHWESFRRYKNTINRAGVSFRTPNFDAEFYVTPGRRRGGFAG